MVNHFHDKKFIITPFPRRRLSIFLLGKFQKLDQKLRHYEEETFSFLSVRAECLPEYFKGISDADALASKFVKANVKKGSEERTRKIGKAS